MSVILAGDFNVKVTDNYNTELVEFMKDNFSDLTFFQNFLTERINLILTSIWYFDEMSTIYPA
jgi:hypothetical protein